MLDHVSDLIIYRIGDNTVTSDPKISDPKRMKIFPCWAPDGRSPFFCRSPELESYMIEMDGAEDLAWDRIRYSLMRIEYDPETQEWGNWKPWFLQRI